MHLATSVMANSRPVYDVRGNRMSPSFTVKNGVRYPFYVSAAFFEEAQGSPLGGSAFYWHLREHCSAGDARTDSSEGRPLAFLAPKLVVAILRNSDCSICLSTVNANAAQIHPIIYLINMIIDR